MRYRWLVVMVVTLVPAIVVTLVRAAAASLLCNPLVFLLLRPEAWREQGARIHPIDGGSPHRSSR
jgi:hypothetical protein